MIFDDEFLTEFHMKAVNDCAVRLKLTIANERDPSAVWHDDLDHWWRGRPVGRAA